MTCGTGPGSGPGPGAGQGPGPGPSITACSEAAAVVGPCRALIPRWTYSVSYKLCRLGLHNIVSSDLQRWVHRF